MGNAVFKKSYLLYFHRSVKDAVAQTSEIITYEADVQSIHRVDQEVNTYFFCLL